MNPRHPIGCLKRVRALVGTVARTLLFDAPRGFGPLAALAALVDLGVAPSPLLHAVADLPGYGELRFEPSAMGTRATLAAEPGARDAIAEAALAKAIEMLGSPAVVVAPREPARFSGYVARGTGEDAATGRVVEAALGDLTPT